MCKKVLIAKVGPTKTLITHFKICMLISKHEESLPATNVHLIVFDNLSFSLFVTPLELRKFLTARGFNVPKSKETIKAKFMVCYQKRKEDTKGEIKSIKPEDKKCSIVLDEWNSTVNKRYML